jgi:dUTP pyrophosphatase
MKLIPIKVVKKNNDVILPERKTTGSAGYDVYSYLPERTAFIQPRKIVLIPTGLFFEIPQNYEIEIRPRSGLSVKNYLLIPNTPGTIDSDYRGELFIPLLNASEIEVEILHKMRIAQMFIRESFAIHWLESKGLEKTTERGDAGFGSTGLFDPS